VPDVTTGDLYLGSHDSLKEPTAYPGSGLRVLLAEGDEGNAEFMTVLLEADGHQVQVAPNGPAALRLAQAHPPDVVLLEIRLPRMDGWEVARRLREQAMEKKPFCIAIASCGTAADRRRSKEAGIELHMLKPVDTRYLRTVLRGVQAIIGMDELIRWPTICKSCATVTTATSHDIQTTIYLPNPQSKDACNSNVFRGN